MEQLRRASDLNGNRGNWSGETFRERAMALHMACEHEEETSTFDFAAQKTLQTTWLAEIVDTPLANMQASIYGKLARAMEHYLLHYELQRCIEILAQVALQPLTSWLQQEGVTRYSSSLVEHWRHFRS